MCAYCDKYLFEYLQCAGSQTHRPRTQPSTDMTTLIDYDSILESHKRAEFVYERLKHEHANPFDADMRNGTHFTTRCFDIIRSILF
jgi:hypothetical protein